MIIASIYIIIDLPRFMKFFISGILPLIISSTILTGQGFIINPGVTVVNSGNLVLSKDFINDGLFSDNNGTVIFSGITQTIGGTIGTSFYNITVLSGSTTTIASAGQTLKRILLCNGTLNAGGNITLLSTATQTALIDGSGIGQVPGNLTMQRYLSSGFGYKYFSSPFQTATVNEFGDDMNLAASFPSFYRYDENLLSSGWVSYINPNGVLNAMLGYAANFGSLAAAKTVDVTGVVNNGDLSLTLYNHNFMYTKGFNLIGNPYPSPIDWDALSGWTKTNIDNAVYYFKASTSDQYGGTYSTYINGVSSDSIVNNIIPSMQGFFVHVSDGSWPVTGILAMNNNVRIADLTHSFTKSKGLNAVPLLRLTSMFSDDTTSSDPVVIYFDEKAGTHFDSQLDALKLFNTDLKVTNLYTIIPDSTKLAIKALPAISDNLCTVPLGLKLNKTGKIIFKISDIDETLSGMRIYLTDINAGIEQDLLPDKEYIVSLTKGEYNNRFFLNLSTNTTDIKPEILESLEMFAIYSSHGVLKAEIKRLTGKEGRLIIINLTGQVLFIKEVFDTGYLEFNPGLKDGIYIASFTTGTKRSSKKISIQNR
jgi:hypothetical protein